MSERKNSHNTCCGGGKGSSDKLQLYALPLSPPSRAVHLAVKLMQIPHDYILIDVLGGGTRTEDYLKMNPQHTVPTIKYGDYHLSESRAILLYLCEEFNGETYYPKDKQLRGLINHRLYFDIGTLYRRLGDALYPVCFGQRNFIPEETRKALDESMQWLEEFLKENKYAAGDVLTIADISLVATVSTYEACEKGLTSLDKFPKVKEWMEKLKTELPEYESACGEGAAAYRSWFEQSYKPEDQQKAKLVPQMTIG